MSKSTNVVEESDSINEDKDQQPHSMMTGDSIPDYLKKYRFEGWVFFKVEVERKKRRKSIFGKNTVKYQECYLKYHKTGRIDLFKSDKDEKPHSRYSLRDGTFKRTDRKKYEFMANSREVVTHEQTPVYVRCLNNLEYGNLCRLMVKSGVEEIDKPKPKELTRITNSAIKVFFENPVRDWGFQEVVEWSKCIITGDDFRETLFDIGNKYIEKEKLTGKEILKWQKKDIISFADELNMRSFRSKSRLKREILKLQSNPFFDPLKSIVMRKVVKMLEKQKHKKGNIIINRFTKAFGSSQVMYENMKSILYPKENEDVKKPKLFRVKLIIVENMQDDRLKRFRRVFGRILEVRDALNVMDENTKYGLFHASVSIGPLQLEWVDSSITIVRPISSEKVILCVDVDNLEIPDGEIFMKRLVKECLRWNREYHYESFTIQKNQLYANCQHFVQHILKFLDLEYNPGKDIRKFLKQMKHRGVAQMVFSYDRKFARKFFSERGNSVSLEFKPATHEQLDMFVSGLFKVMPSFERDFPSQYQLLKGFDRAFWMKYLKDRLNKDYQCAERRKLKGSEDWRLSGCPFCMPKKIRKKLKKQKEEEADDDDDEEEGEEEGEELPQDIKEIKETIERDTGEPLSHEIVMNMMKMKEMGDQESFDLMSSMKSQSGKRKVKIRKHNRRKKKMRMKLGGSLGARGVRRGDTYDVDDLETL